MNERYRDRAEAGRELAKHLQKYADMPDLLVLALPRGGIVVAFEVSLALNGELDVFLVRKLGAPYEPELAMGAIAEGGILLLNDAVVNYLSISKETIEETAQQQLAELQRRQQLYRNGRPSPRISGRPVIVVDDGVATGATMKAALKAIKRKEPSVLVAAVPVGAQSTCLELKAVADEVVCLEMPEPFMSVGLWYEDFRQIEDSEVTELLQKAFKHQKNEEG
ncbi:MAG: phosphoribosyltransferase [Fibrobacter sp.]|jgi:putative phosphoribosyl transferase|nr:phosphoribosyltransferase [Fibrobacter sp.]